MKTIDCKSLNSVYLEISERLGPDAAYEIFTMFRGQQITFPTRFYDRAAIHEKIREEYTGANIRQLANKYNYSEKSIRRILKDET